MNQMKKDLEYYGKTVNMLNEALEIQDLAEVREILIEDEKLQRGCFEEFNVNLDLLFNEVNEGRSSLWKSSIAPSSYS